MFCVVRSDSINGFAFAIRNPGKRTLVVRLLRGITDSEPSHAACYHLAHTQHGYNGAMEYEFRGGRLYVHRTDEEKARIIDRLKKDRRSGARHSTNG